MFILHKEKHVVGERRKCGETTAESGDEKHVHVGGNKVGFFSHSEKDSDNKTTDDIDSESTPRERGSCHVVSKFTY